MLVSSLITGTTLVSAFSLPRWRTFTFRMIFPGGMSSLSPCGLIPSNTLPTSIEIRLSTHLTSEIELIQTIRPDRLTTLLFTRLEFLQLKLRDLQRKEIDGYIVF